MSYYRGDYYRGDFWSGLGKGIKRIGRDIGRAAKAVAPIAGIILPAVGAATLVGRGVNAARKVKEFGRTARGIAQQVAPNPNQTPIAIAAQLTGQTVGMPVLRVPESYRASDRTMAQPEHKLWMESGAQTNAAGVPVIPGAAAAPRRRRRRRPQRRLRRTTRARTTTRRRRRRSTRSR